MKLRERTCRYCRKPFLPQRQNAWHQRYCTQPECRAASHRASHWRWLRRNPDAHQGDANVKRVQQWRADHPGRHPIPLDTHLFVDVRVSAARDKPAIAVLIEDRKVGRLRDFYIAQPLNSKGVRLLSVESLRDLMGSSLRNWYHGWRRKDRSPPMRARWRRQEH